MLLIGKASIMATVTINLSYTELHVQILEFAINISEEDIILQLCQLMIPNHMILNYIITL